MFDRALLVPSKGGAGLFEIVQRDGDVNRLRSCVHINRGPSGRRYAVAERLEGRFGRALEHLQRDRVTLLVEGREDVVERIGRYLKEFLANVGVDSIRMNGPALAEVRLERVGVYDCGDRAGLTAEVCGDVVLCGLRVGDHVVSQRFVPPAHFAGGFAEGMDRAARGGDLGFACAHDAYSRVRAAGSRWNGDLGAVGAGRRGPKGRDGAVNS